VPIICVDASGVNAAFNDVRVLGYIAVMFVLMPCIHDGFETIYKAFSDPVVAIILTSICSETVLWLIEHGHVSAQPYDRATPVFTCLQRCTSPRLMIV